MPLLASLATSSMHNASWHASATLHRRHDSLPCALPLPLAAFKDGQLDLPAELRKLQAQLCTALAAAPAPNATAIVPADLQQLVRGLSAACLPATMTGGCGSFQHICTCLLVHHEPASNTCTRYLTLICCILLPYPSTLQLQTRLCNGTQPSAATDLGSLAPTVEQLLGGGLGGLAGQLDALLGTNGTVQVCMWVGGGARHLCLCWRLCMHLASHQLTPGQQMLSSLISPAPACSCCAGPGCWAGQRQPH